MGPPLIVILAGGAGRRMGGADKAFLDFGGRPLIERLVERLGPQGAGILVNSNGDPARFAGLGLPVVADSIPDRPGPLAGILAGLDWATARGIGEIVTVPVDLPFVPLDLVSTLQAARGEAAIACAASNGRRHGIVALWPSRFASDLRRILVEDGVRKVEAAMAYWAVTVAEFGPDPVDPFLNLNRPEDLAEALHFA